MFTNEYSQPGEYHFSLDSVLLARRAAELAFSFSGARVLDLCAGCGVVGLDLAYFRPEVASVDFVEVQAIYSTHFERNRTLFGPHTRFSWHLANYCDLAGRSEWQGRFDLIVSNPPYFAPGTGRLPPSEFKARCRFFLDGDFLTLVHSVDWMLAPEGVALILVRTEQNRTAVFEWSQSKTVKGRRGVVMDEDIRGTSLVRIGPSVMS